MSRDESPAEIVERLRGERVMRNPSPPLRRAVVITGGRDHEPTAAEMGRFWVELDRLGAEVLHHGAAAGVDRFVAREVRRRRPGVRVVDHPANWGLYGRQAGPIRNREMVTEPGAVALLAFPGGRGTRSCEEEARHAGLEVVYLYDLPAVAGAHEHVIRAWTWSAARAVWVARCSECWREVVADPATAAALERAVDAHATAAG